MDRRKTPRYSRRIPLSFWSQKDSQPKKGFTQNISQRGLFIGTHAPFSVGIWVTIELPLGERMIQLEGQVRSSLRIAPALRKLKESGMGVRLFRTEELMQEIILPKAIRDQQEGLSRDSPETEDSKPSDEAPAVFSVYLNTPADLSRVFSEHIKHGGVFVPTAQSSKVKDLVGVEFLFDWIPDTVIQTTGKVVRTFSSVDASGGERGVAGIGVAFSDPTQTVAHFRQLLNAPDSPDANSSHP